MPLIFIPETSLYLWYIFKTQFVILKNNDMYDFRRIMVGLDLSLMDRAIIEQLAFISDKINPLKIYFTHIHRDLSVPASVVKDFPQFREPMDEKIKKEMKKKVESLFPGISKYDVEYEVIEGSPSKELLNRVEIKNIDLLIMGRKNELPGNGVIPRQVARSCKSSVWFVPEKTTNQFSNIAIPLDFSKHSKLAMEEALKLTENEPNINLYPIHIYTMPQFGAGVSYGQIKLEPIIRENAVEEYNSFIADMNTDGMSISPIFKLDHRYIGANYAYEIAYQKQADLIIVGCQGKTGVNRWIMGSFSEKLIEANTDIPLLVVKRKIDRE